MCHSRKKDAKVTGAAVTSLSHTTIFRSVHLSRSIIAFKTNHIDY